jgi:uncharacterized protein (DUF433 family)
MNHSNRIESNPDIMLGKPIIKGTRITVELILKKLSTGFSIENILESYNNLTREDILAAIDFNSPKNKDFIVMEEQVNKLRYKIPENFKFDRDEANER